MLLYDTPIVCHMENIDDEFRRVSAFHVYAANAELCRHAIIILAR